TGQRLPQRVCRCWRVTGAGRATPINTSRQPACYDRSISAKSAQLFRFLSSSDHVLALVPLFRGTLDPLATTENIPPSANPLFKVLTVPLDGYVQPIQGEPFHFDQCEVAPIHST